MKPESSELRGQAAALRPTSFLERTGSDGDGRHRGQGLAPGEGRGRSAGARLGELRAQESLDGCVDVPSRGDEGLQVGLAVDEAHGVELFELLLEPHFWCLHL